MADTPGIKMSVTTRQDAERLFSGQVTLGGKTVHYDLTFKLDVKDAHKVLPEDRGVEGFRKMCEIEFSATPDGKAKLEVEDAELWSLFAYLIVSLAIEQFMINSLRDAAKGDKPSIVWPASEIPKAKLYANIQVEVISKPAIVQFWKKLPKAA